MLLPEPLLPQRATVWGGEGQGRGRAPESAAACCRHLQSECLPAGGPHLAGVDDEVEAAQHGLGGPRRVGEVDVAEL